MELEILEMKVNKVYKEKGVAFKNLKVGTFLQIIVNKICGLK